MSGDNRALQDLVGLLATVHRELRRQMVVNPGGTGAAAGKHHATRCLISQQEARTSGDVRLLLMAAEMAQGIDPRFADDEPGSALDLLRRAVAAIEQIHAQHRLDADALLATLRPPARR